MSGLNFICGLNDEFRDGLRELFEDCPQRIWIHMHAIKIHPWPTSGLEQLFLGAKKQITKILQACYTIAHVPTAL